MPEPKTNAPDPKNDNDTQPAWVDELKETFSQQLDEKITPLTEELEALKTAAPTTTDTEEGEGWKPKTWDEVLEKAGETVKSEFAERDRQYQEAQVAQQATQAEIDKGYDAQEAQLEKDGILPAKTTEEGKVARKELYGYAVKMNSDNLLAVGEELKRQHDMGYQYDVTNNKWLRTNTPPAGAQAPVGSSNQSGAAIESGRPGWKEIHEARDLHTLAERAKQEIG